MAKEKRVEVLFEPAEYRTLEDAAHRQGKSVGAMVREAVAKYVVRDDSARRAEAAEWFRSHAEGPTGSPQEIKQAIVNARYQSIASSLEERKAADEAR